MPKARSPLERLYELALLGARARVLQCELGEHLGSAVLVALPAWFTVRVHGRRSVARSRVQLCKGGAWLSRRRAAQAPA